MSLPLDLNEAFPLERFQQSANSGAASFFLTTIPTRIAIPQFMPRRAGSVVGEGGESNADHKCGRANLVARGHWMH
jgi:hypothetical protein